jgi:hypothetical protein
MPFDEFDMRLWEQIKMSCKQNSTWKQKRSKIENEYQIMGGHNGKNIRPWWTTMRGIFYHGGS